MFEVGDLVRINNKANGRYSITIKGVLCRVDRWDAKYPSRVSVSVVDTSGVNISQMSLNHIARYPNSTYCIASECCDIATTRRGNYVQNW